MTITVAHQNRRSVPAGPRNDGTDARHRETEESLGHRAGCRKQEFIVLAVAETPLPRESRVGWYRGGVDLDPKLRIRVIHEAGSVAANAVAQVKHRMEPVA